MEKALDTHEADRTVPESEEKFRRLVERAKDVIYRMSLPDGKYEYVSPASRDVFGYSPEEFYATPLLIGKIIHPDWPANFEKQWARLVEGHMPSSYEYRIVHISGEVRWIHQRNVLIRNDLGQPIAIEGIATDISDRKRLEEALRENERRYKLLAENTLDASWQMDLDLRFTYINDAIARIMGYSVEEWIGTRLQDHCDEEQFRNMAQIVATAIAKGPTGQGTVFEAVMLKRDKTPIHVEIHGKLVWGEDGHPVAVQGITRDVTERKQAEMALKRAHDDLEQRVEERTRELTELSEQLKTEIATRRRTEEALRREKTFIEGALDALTDAFVVFDLEQKFLRWNKAVTEVTGYTDEEISSMKPTDLFSGEEVRRVSEGIASAVENGHFKLDASVVTKQGTHVPFELTLDLLKDLEGKPTSLCAVGRDISGRKRTEQVLRESQGKYHRIIEYMGDAYFEVDLAGNMLFCNDSTCRLIGYTREELVGMNNRVYMNADTAKKVFRCFNRVYRTGEAATLSGWQMVKKDGTRRLLETQVSLVRDAEGQPSGFRGYSRDVTAKMEAEAAFRESEAKYRTIIENIEEGYHEVDRAGNLIFCNDAMCKILGYSKDELIGMNYRQYIDPSSRDRVYGTYNSVYRSGHPVTVPGWKVITKDGNIRTVDVSVSLIRNSDGKKIGFRGLVIDVTERERIRMQGLQAQKMEAIGSLAGGIAHDFNNILYAIIGFTEMALEEVPRGTVLRSNLETVFNSGHRAKDLVQQILAFSRQSRQERQLLNVKPILKEVLKFLRASLPSTIEITHTIEPALRPVVADPTEIHRIFMNLCLNAGHAMREQGGVLDLIVKNVGENEIASTIAPELILGSYIRMTVRDTGTGISNETIERIFEPYFTTKQKGEGTGLGLAVVHGIVASYGGTIRVHSDLGKGSTFHVYLPSIEAKQQHEADNVKSVPTGSERILFIDDELSIAELATQMLERLGYEVVSHTDSLEGLALFRARPNDFDLIITDMTMPKMTGLELAREIRNIHSDIPLILCTGFSDLITEDRLRALGITEVVNKPILKKDMAKAIRRVIDR